MMEKDGNFKAECNLKITQQNETQYNFKSSELENLQSQIQNNLNDLQSVALLQINSPNNLSQFVEQSIEQQLQRKESQTSNTTNQSAFSLLLNRDTNPLFDKMSNLFEQRSKNQVQEQQQLAIDNAQIANQFIFLIHQLTQMKNQNHFTENLRMKREQSFKDDEENLCQSNNQKTKFCNCKKSKCLKLYCECFASGEKCNKLCNCIDCANHLLSVYDKENATNIMGLTKMKKGCNCKKSNCQKKYCECFINNQYCNDACRCKDCYNQLRSEDSDQNLSTLDDSNDSINIEQILQKLEYKDPIQDKLKQCL